jgi:hypothetical protein
VQNPGMQLLLQSLFAESAAVEDFLLESTFVFDPIAYWMTFARGGSIALPSLLYRISWPKKDIH